MDLQRIAHSLTRGIALALLFAAGPARADGDRDGRHGADWDEVSIANLNLLHGHQCDPPTPGDGDQCRVRDRIRLLLEHVVGAGCPDVVTLQENVTEEFVQRAAGVTVGPLDDTVELISRRLRKLARQCDFRYELVFDPEGATEPPAETGRGIDEELILTRYPAIDAEVAVLYSPLSPFFSRHVLFARIDHPAGPIDVFTTHLAAGTDLGGQFCGIPALPGPPSTPPSPPCPAECVAGPGGDSVRECQLRQLAAFVADRHDVANPAFVTGDLNAEPTSRVYQRILTLGWIDSHLAAGNAECDPATGLNCSGGREDSDLSELEGRALNQDERIDYIFVVPAARHATCSGEIETGHQGDDFDEVETGPFAAVPNPFARRCGADPREICWTSDHSGNIATLECDDRHSWQRAPWKRRR